MAPLKEAIEGLVFNLVKGVRSVSLDGDKIWDIKVGRALLNKHLPILGSIVTFEE